MALNACEIYAVDTLIHKLKNKSVLKKYGVNTTLLAQSERNLLRWLGHSERIEGVRLTKHVYLGKWNGSVPRGRPREEWCECVNDTLQRQDIKRHRNTKAPSEGRSSEK